MYGELIEFPEEKSSVDQECVTLRLSTTYLKKKRKRLSNHADCEEKIHADCSLTKQMTSANCGQHSNNLNEFSANTGKKKFVERGAR